MYVPTATLEEATVLLDTPFHRLRHRTVPSVDEVARTTTPLVRAVLLADEDEVDDHFLDSQMEDDHRSHHLACPSQLLASRNDNYTSDRSLMTASDITTKQSHHAYIRRHPLVLFLAFSMGVFVTLGLMTLTNLTDDKDKQPPPSPETSTNRRWTQLGQHPNGDNTGDTFGVSLALADEGRIVAAGGGEGKNQTGYVRVWQYNIGTDHWDSLGSAFSTLSLTGQEEIGDSLGRGVALSASGRILAVGVPGKAKGRRKEDQLMGQVSVFSYDSPTEQWRPLGLPVDGQGGQNNFGAAVALSADGMTLVAGHRATAITAQDPGMCASFGTIRNHMAIFLRGNKSVSPYRVRILPTSLGTRSRFPRMARL